MSRTEHLKRRLPIAVREAEDADRVWRATMALAVPVADEREVKQAARRLHAVWQEREAALARVRELERMIAGGQGRSRRRRLQQGGSFLMWHTRRRLGRTSAAR